MFRIAQGIADAHRARIKYADDIAGIGGFDNGAFRRQKLLRLGEPDRFARLPMQDAHAFFKLS